MAQGLLFTVIVVYRLKLLAYRLKLISNSMKEVTTIIALLYEVLRFKIVVAVLCLTGFIFDGYSHIGKQESDYA